MRLVTIDAITMIKEHRYRLLLPSGQNELKGDGGRDVLGGETMKKGYHLELKWWEGTAANWDRQCPSGNSVLAISVS